MRAYQDMVFSTAARLTANDRQAEDISQEAFLKAFEHFDDLKESPTAGGWLKTVTTNLALNHLARYRRRWRFFSELAPAGSEDSAAASAMPASLDISPQDMSSSAAGTPLGQIWDDERAAIIETALRKLPEHQRLPLVLYHFEEMSYDEIAAKLRVSLSKVKTDISRARAALLPLLQSAGIDSHVDA